MTDQNGSDEQLQTLVNRNARKRRWCPRRRHQQTRRHRRRAYCPSPPRSPRHRRYREQLGKFGFPAVLRERDPPRYLDLPEVRWPGVRDALAAIADPTLTPPTRGLSGSRGTHSRTSNLWTASMSGSTALPFVSATGRWFARLRATGLRPAEHPVGNCDRSFLAALNAPNSSLATLLIPRGPAGTTNDI